jgi:cytochrome oxidase Cu insertion factor (SCO1/SenC/PrrC family)
MDYNYNHFRFTHVMNEARRTWQLEGPQPGAFAPDFELRDVDGQAWRLRQHQGKPVLLHFGSYT